MTKSTTYPAPVLLGPSAQELKLTRRASRQYGLFAPHLLRAALKQSFVMLRPDVQWKNPVMFVVEVGTVLSVLYTIAKAVHPAAYAPSLGYLIALDVWLFLTVLFANFASALAEARGKAQADTLRKTRQETPAYRLPGGQDPEAALFKGGTGLVVRSTGVAGTVGNDGYVEQTVSTALREGDLVLVEAGQVISRGGGVFCRRSPVGGVAHHRAAGPPDCAGR